MSEKTHVCSTCKKAYSSQSSLSNHVRIKHDIRKHNTIKTHICKYCNKEFGYQQSKWLHEKKCKIKQEQKVKEDAEAQNKIVLLQKELEHKNEIIRLQKKLLKSKRIDAKTFKEVNKILMNRSYNNSINMTNSNNNSNNNTYQILSLGNEELSNVLTIEQKKQILNSRMMSLEKIVEITHCGEMNQF
jgi:hypothetical protein